MLKGDVKLELTVSNYPSPPIEVDGKLCFRQRRYVGRYNVREQLPGANASPIVTKLRQSYPWPQGMRSLNFGRSRSVGEVCTLLNALLVASVMLRYLMI